ncbi:nuclear transport factor 2 family protein [Enterococcus sp. HY326]|uniref:nuclear transport factor 2 family protein n=1 Tax=Enterococcus sp. HY326 TaxID=2971265 RepID=UPI00223EED85|nr:nuclear transport factor 2 family protein [Enterococcus sp. HY326]
MKRDTWFQLIEQGLMAYKTIKIHNVTIEVNNQQAVAHYQSVMTADFLGYESHWQFYNTDIFVKQADTWQLSESQSPIYY